MSTGMIISKLQKAYRIKFERQNLSNLKSKHEADQDYEVTTPKVSGVDVIASLEVILSENDVTAARCTKQSAGLIGSQNIPA